MKKPARSGAPAGLSNAFLAVREERYAPVYAPRQASYLASHFGLSPTRAALIAELAYPAVDTWREAHR